MPIYLIAQLVLLFPLYYYLIRVEFNFQQCKKGLRIVQESNKMA